MYTLVAVTTNAQYEAMKAIRHQVFVVEQNVPPDLEQAQDDKSHLFLLLQDNQHIACGRWRPTTENSAKIERCAVLAQYRGKGVGNMLVQKIIEQIPPTYKVYLHAQIHAKSFYQKLGFIPEGAEFTEADILHIKMVLNRS